MQPKGREFEPRTLHSFLHGSALLPHFCGAIAFADPLADSAPGFGIESPAYVAIRTLMYLAALLVIGACAFVLLIAPRVTLFSGTRMQTGRVVPAARLLGLTASILLAIAMIARLLAQAYVLSEGEDYSTMLGGILGGTIWGWGWIAGAVAAAMLVAALVAARRRRGAWTLAALSMVIVAISFSLTGHAASASPAWLHVAVDATHVLAAGGWIGTLLVVTVVGLRAVQKLAPEVRGNAAVELIGAFSNFALVCAGTLAVTGVFAGWTQVQTVSALWHSSYGQTLCTKLIALGLTALVGAYNWRIVRPRLARAEALPLLRRSATVELAIGALVVLITAVLVATSPPDRDDANANRSLLAPSADSTLRHTITRVS